MVLDYSKFEHVGDDDEQLEEQRKKEAELAKRENGSSTHIARGLLADPLLVGVMAELHEKTERDEKLKVDKDAREGLLTFVVVQAQGAAEADNTRCAPAVIEFMQSGKAPKVSLMLAFTWAVHKRIEASSRPKSETEPIRSLLMGALNTLLACAKKESAAALFEHLKRTPDSDFARRYFGREFARARFDKYAAAALHAETKWYYGDDIPWRDYAPQSVQDALDGAYALCESRPKVMLACATFVAFVAAHIYDTLYYADYHEAALAMPAASTSGVPPASVQHDEV